MQLSISPLSQEQAEVPILWLCQHPDGGCQPRAQADHEAKGEESIDHVRGCGIDIWAHVWSNICNCSGKLLFKSFYVMIVIGPVWPVLAGWHAHPNVYIMWGDKMFPNRAPF